MNTTKQTIPRQAPALPTNRAFVVQFSEQAEESPAQWAGRIEHIVSGHATHFASWVELQTFMEQALVEVRDKPRKKKRSYAQIAMNEIKTVYILT